MSTVTYQKSPLMQGLEETIVKVLALIDHAMEEPTSARIEKANQLSQVVEILMRARRLG